MLSRIPASAGFNSRLTGGSRTRSAAASPLCEAAVAQRVDAIEEAGRAARRGSRAARGCDGHGRCRASARGSRRPRVESRLPVGSSASSRRGSLASARAIATRWRSPIDSSSGVCGMRSPRPTRSSHGCASRRASLQRAAAAGELDRRVVERRGVRHQVEGLQHEADVAAAVARALALGHERPGRARRSRRLPLSGRASAAASISSVVLPEPLGPVQPDELAGVDAQRDIVDGGDRDGAAAIALADLLQAAACSPRTIARRGEPARAARRRCPRSSLEQSSPSAIDISMPSPCRADISSDAISSAIARPSTAARSSDEEAVALAQVGHHARARRRSAGAGRARASARASRACCRRATASPSAPASPGRASAEQLEQPAAPGAWPRASSAPRCRARSPRARVRVSPGLGRQSLSRHERDLAAQQPRPLAAAHRAPCRAGEAHAAGVRASRRRRPVRSSVDLPERRAPYTPTIAPAASSRKTRSSTTISRSPSR